MAYTGQLGTADSTLGNITLGGAPPESGSESIAQNQEQSDAFTVSHARLMTVADTQAPSDYFDVLKTRRADIYAWYLEVVSYLNTNRPKNVPPAPTRYDLDDSGRVQPLDALILSIWYTDGIISLPIKRTWTQVSTFSVPEVVPLGLYQTWAQSDSFSPSMQSIIIRREDQHFAQTDVWLNPTYQEANLSLIWYTTESFIVTETNVQFSDHLTFTQNYDTIEKSRTLADTWSQVSTFDRTQWIAQTWTQIDAFVANPEEPRISQIWNQTSVYRIPQNVSLSTTWTQTVTVEDAQRRENILVVWDVPAIVTPDNSGWLPEGNITFPPQEPPEVVGPFETGERWTVIGGGHAVEWHDSPYAAEFLDSGSPIILGFVSWWGYTVQRVPAWTDIINWDEDWRIILDAETLSQTWSQTDSFDNEIKWESFSDTSLPTESWTWAAVYNGISDVQNQISAFTKNQDFLLASTVTQNLTDVFLYQIGNYTGSTTTAQPIWSEGTGTFALIDNIETLELRNPVWGNVNRLETTRVVGITRSGTPYVGRRTHWPQREIFEYTIRTMTDEKFDNILDFIERNIGKNIQWRDHYGITRSGYIQEPATPIRRRSRCRGQVALTLVEGS